MAGGPPKRGWGGVGPQRSDWGGDGPPKSGRWQVVLRRVVGRRWSSKE